MNRILFSICAAALAVGALAPGVVLPTDRRAIEACAASACGSIGRTNHRNILVAQRCFVVNGQLRCF